MILSLVFTKLQRMVKKIHKCLAQIYITILCYMDIAKVSSTKPLKLLIMGGNSNDVLKIDPYTSVSNCQQPKSFPYKISDMTVSTLNAGSEVLGELILWSGNEMTRCIFFIFLACGGFDGKGNVSSCHKYSLGVNGYEWTEFATLHKSVRYSTSVYLEYPVDPICSLCETVEATWVIGDGDPNSRDTEFVDNKTANRTFKGSLFFQA